MRKLIALVALALVSSILAPSASTAAADDTECTGVLGPVTVDNIVVPPNAVCKLIGTQVQGNIKILENATFDATNANIHGDVQSDKSFYTDLYIGSRVGGDVQIKNSAVDTDICGTTIIGDLQLEGIGGTLDAARIGETFHPAGVTNCVAGANKVVIGGNLQAQKNRRPVDIFGSEVGGNLQFFENFGGLIFNNLIVGNLQCEKNDPPPLGAGNTAAAKEGQCAGF